MPDGSAERVPWRIHTDGASRGNPGPAAIGVVIERPDGVVWAELSRCIGETTNNYAEYVALSSALDLLEEIDASEPLQFTLDSELVVRQLNGIYKVRAPELLPLYQAIVEKCRRHRSVEFVHTRRRHNSRADALANAALDGKSIGDGSKGQQGIAP